MRTSRRPAAPSLTELTAISPYDSVVAEELDRLRAALLDERVRHRAATAATVNISEQTARAVRASRPEIRRVSNPGLAAAIQPSELTAKFRALR